MIWNWLFTSSSLGTMSSSIVQSLDSNDCTSPNIKENLEGDFPIVPCTSNYVPDPGSQEPNENSWKYSKRHYSTVSHGFAFCFFKLKLNWSWHQKHLTVSLLINFNLIMIKQNTKLKKKNVKKIFVLKFSTSKFEVANHNW